MNIAVGSTNPVKIEAVKQAFTLVWPDKQWIVTGYEVKSGVSNQPMSDEETIRGARTRAAEALKQSHADFAVGLEGGLQKIGGQWFDCGWAVVINAHGQEGIGSTIKMETPEKLMQLIHAGHELGVANDIIFNTNNSKHANGHFGLMTNNAITRTTGYRDGTISALARFIQKKVYEL